MGELSSLEMFSASVPATWRGVLEPLADLERLLRDENMSLDEKRQAAIPVRETLHQEAHRLIGETPQSLCHLSADHRRTFSEAVILSSYFPRTVGSIRLDTLHCKSLEKFPVDMQGTEYEREILCAALREAFGWTDTEIDAMRGKIVYLTEGLRLKHALTEILCAQLRADSANDDLAAAIRRLFQKVYGAVPFRPGDIGVTITEASVSFGIWFRDAAVTRKGYESRPVEERDEIHNFLTNLRKDSWRTDRFPGFGHFDETTLSDQLVSQVTESVHDVPVYADVRAEVVAHTLCTMFSCFSAHETEKYLIHDTWGHCWQQSLCEFEWSYYDLAFVREDLSPDTGVRFAKRPSNQALASAFEVLDGTVELNRERARAIIEAEIRGRITVCVNAVVAEMLADLVEHKFMRYAGRDADIMQSSSMFRDRPLKIDLTYEDIGFHLRFWRRPFRRIMRQPASRTQLAEQLHGAGLPERGLLQAVEALVEVIAEFDAVAFMRKLAVEPLADGRIAIDIPRRLFLAALTVERAVVNYLDNGDAAYQIMREKNPVAPRWHCPMASMDLLLVTLAWMYEQDRDMNFWHLDELIRDELTPTMLQFQKGLEKVLRANA